MGALLVDISQKLGGRQQCPLNDRSAADELRRRRLVRLQEPLANPYGDAVAVTWKYEIEQNELSKQHRRVIAEPIEQPLPIQGCRVMAQQVGDVGHVAPIALEDKRLLPDDFFNGTERKIDIQDASPACMVEPGSVY